MSRWLPHPKVPRLNFRYPRQSEAVIVDRNSSSRLIELLATRRVTLVLMPQESINLWVALRMLFSRHRDTLTYLSTYIKMVRPKLVVTGVDSNAVFYFLKSFHPDSTFISVQNGIRGGFATKPNQDLWSLLRHLTKKLGLHPAVDYMLTLGPAHSRLFESSIDCKAISVGSLSNNSLKPKSQTTALRTTVTLISSFDGRNYRNLFEDGDTDVLRYFGSFAISGVDYFSPLRFLTSLISSICVSNNWDFEILGKRGNDSAAREEQFFLESCIHQAFKFRKKDSETSTLERALESSLTFVWGSTSGYELLSRGHRVVFVNHPIMNGNCVRDTSLCFGFPDRLAEDGPFWTSRLELKHLSSLANRVMSYSSAEWGDIVQRFSFDKFSFDPDNSILKNLINQNLR